MSPALSTFLLEAANFLILASVLSWVLFKPVRKAVQDRRALQEQKEAEIEARLKEGEVLREEALEQRRKLEAELDGIRQEAAAAAANEAEAIRSKAVEAARREQENLRHQLAHLEQSRIEKLGESAAGAARDVVEKLLTDIDGPDLERALLRAACNELRRLGRGNIGLVVVESATPLGPEARTEIESAVNGAGDVQFVSRPELRAGVRIRTAQGLVDASAAGLSAYAQKALVRQMAADEEQPQ